MPKVTLELDATVAGAILDRLKINVDDAQRSLDEAKTRPNSQPRTLSSREVTLYVEKSLHDQYKAALDAAGDKRP